MFKIIVMNIHFCDKNISLLFSSGSCNVISGGDANTVFPFSYYFLLLFRFYFLYNRGSQGYPATNLKF